MNEPTPPPERALPDDARSRIRAQLLQLAHEDRSTTRLWMVPAGAAAAVALVAGLAYWAINPGSEPQHGLPITGDGTSSAPVGPDGSLAPSSVPSTDSSVPPIAPDGTVVPSTESSVTPIGPDASAVGSRSCEEEMVNVLKGATLATQVDGTSSFWVRGEMYVLCDELNGRTTVHKALPLAPRDDVATYAVSSDFLEGQVTRSAGGIVPQGAEEVFDVAYTFPDGHTEHATKSTDEQGRTWWRMVYTYDDGGGNELNKPEIEVTMSLSGVQKHYTLAWGEDTCAQANHGC
jgi:hypothetical protein